MNPLDLLADAAENLYPARMQMALSLGWHIIFACFGIAFPLITVFTEWQGYKRGDAALTELAHTWAKAMGVLFAAGAVSGTLLSVRASSVPISVNPSYRAPISAAPPCRTLTSAPH